MSEYEIDSYGNKEWRVNGLYHREDGPAVVDAAGTKAWYVDGKRHREDGPAIEWADGKKSWYLRGIRYTEDEFVLLQFTRGIIINE